MMNETMMMNDEMNLDELEAVAGGGKVKVGTLVAAALVALWPNPVYPPVPTGRFPHPRT